MYSSTCFRRPHVHHQELNNCSSSPWFYRWSVVIAVLLVVVGLGSARTRPTALLPPRSNGKTRGCYCSCWAPDNGRGDAQNMLSCTQTSSNKLEKLLHLVGWFIWNLKMYTTNRNFKSHLHPKFSNILCPSAFTEVVTYFPTFHTKTTLKVM